MCTVMRAFVDCSTLLVHARCMNYNFIALARLVLLFLRLIRRVLNLLHLDNNQGVSLCRIYNFKVEYISLEKVKERKDEPLFYCYYDGEFPAEKLHTILQSNQTFTNLNVRTISISSPRPFTLLVDEEHDTLTTGLTDKYHLFTKELQTLEKQEKYYFVYDYKIRKTIENPTQKCFPFAQINISVTKFHQMIQK